MSHQWKTSLAILAAVLVLAVLAGCEQLGLVAPQTQEQKILYGFSQVEAAANAVSRLRQRKQVSPEVAKKALQSLKIAKAALDSAVEYQLTGQPQAAGMHLQQFTLLFLEVERILAESRPPPVKPKSAPQTWGAPVTA